MERRERSGGAAKAPARWERWLGTVAVAVASVGMGYLFFSNLWAFLPPDFGCPQGFEFSRESGGLCYWIGIYSYEPRTVLTSFLSGAPLGVPLGPLPQANGVFIEGFVEPNIRWFGWVIWGALAFVSLSLILGFFSRLGALVALIISLELVIGLTGVSSPRGWEWGFPLMVLISVVLFAVPPGRYFGLDRLLRSRLLVLKERGSRLGALLLAFT